MNKKAIALLLLIATTPLQASPKEIFKKIALYGGALLGVGVITLIFYKQNQELYYLKKKLIQNDQQIAGIANRAYSSLIKITKKIEKLRKKNEIHNNEIITEKKNSLQAQKNFKKIEETLNTITDQIEKQNNAIAIEQNNNTQTQENITNITDTLETIADQIKKQNKAITLGASKQRQTQTSLDENQKTIETMTDQINLHTELIQQTKNDGTTILQKVTNLTKTYQEHNKNMNTLIQISEDQSNQITTQMPKIEEERSLVMQQIAQLKKIINSATITTLAKKIGVLQEKFKTFVAQGESQKNK